MNNLLEILEWDSSFFGYPVAKVIAKKISADDLERIMNEAGNKGIRLLYLFTDPADEISLLAAKAGNAMLVDQKITFHIKIDASVVTAVDSHIEQFTSPYPSAQLVNLSIQSGSHSRYKIDRGFKNNEFEKLYLAWIENSVNKKIADHTFVYMEDGLELGFVTLKIRDTHGQIGLIAVDETSRGKSIGKKLVSAVISLLHEKKITDLEVATQIDNADACNFYKKVGFSGIKTENIYHIWF
ncbi:MAG: GNAT family N-acetyltransferase [Ferruginibacter sp.]